MSSSFLIAAPPLVVLLLLLWSLDRFSSRLGISILISVLWGGLGATAIVTGLSTVWLEQPQWYPYVVTPTAEEVAKALVFVPLIVLGVVTRAPAGLALGLACGLGFALWENAAYFERYGDSGPPTWLYAGRTLGPALLHATATALVGAASGLRGAQLPLWKRLALIFGAVLLASLFHGLWNFACLVVADTSALRRSLPIVALLILVSALAWALHQQRMAMRVEILELWKEGVLPEKLAKALVGPRQLKRLEGLGVPCPRHLVAAVARLVQARGELSGRHQSQLDLLTQKVRDLLDGKAPPPRQWRRPVTLAATLVFVSAALHFWGEQSPVPGALARRTTVVASGLEIRPEPLMSLDGPENAYLLWQRKGSSREQVLSWFGQAGSETRTVGKLPDEREDWFEMSTTKGGVVVGTREGTKIWLRYFSKTKKAGETRFEAPYSERPPCWPWLASDRGKTIVAWDRLRSATRLNLTPLGPSAPLVLPDPFADSNEGEDACYRGFVVTDKVAYQVARPTKSSRLASIDLDTLEARSLDLCPTQPTARVHAIAKDDQLINVLFGGYQEGEYQLWVARVDRSGQILSTCRHLRAMPSGQPTVVGLAASGNQAFLSWSTRRHLLLLRRPLPFDPVNEDVQRERRWVLDRAPREGIAVVRLGIVERRLIVAWEGPSPGGKFSLKLLRTAIDDLP